MSKTSSPKNPVLVARKRLGLTQSALSRIASVEVHSLLAIEKGRTVRPHALTRARLAEVLGVSESELFPTVRRFSADGWMTKLPTNFIVPEAETTRPPGRRRTNAAGAEGNKPRTAQRRSRGMTRNNASITTTSATVRRTVQ